MHAVPITYANQRASLQDPAKMRLLRPLFMQYSVPFTLHTIATTVANVSLMVLLLLRIIYAGRDNSVRSGGETIGDEFTNDRIQY